MIIDEPPPEIVALPSISSWDEIVNLQQHYLADVADVSGALRW